MITYADVIFLGGVVCILGGAYFSGTADGLIASGVGICVAAVVLRRVQVARRMRRRRGR